MHEGKGKVWVLDTDTKGTGARMVPLEEVQQRPAGKGERFFGTLKREPAPAESAPRAPRRFKIVDVMTRQILAEDVDARAVLDVLGAVERSVDVNVFVWAPNAERWRLLTLREQKALWERRRPAPA